MTTANHPSTPQAILEGAIGNDCTGASPSQLGRTKVAAHAEAQFAVNLPDLSDALHAIGNFSSTCR